MILSYQQVFYRRQKRFRKEFHAHWRTACVVYLLERFKITEIPKLKAYLRPLLIDFVTLNK